MAKATPTVARTPVLKPRFNLYTMMLMVSFFAIVTGCVLLWLELDRFKEVNSTKWWWDTSGVTLPN